MKISRLALSAGGAKVGSYLGMYEALYESNLINSIEKISGSSAGSIAASLISVGIHPKELQKIIETIDFSEILGNIIRVNNPPFICKDGKPMKNVLRIVITRAVYRYLHSNLNNEKCKELYDELFKNACNCYTCSTCHNYNNHCTGKKIKLTFGHLKQLRELAPTKFKEPIISTVSVEDKNIRVFDFNTPDVELVKAVVASSAITVVIKPVGIFINGKKEAFTDGGLFDYIPIDKFDINELGIRYNKYPENTLVVMFSDNRDKTLCTARRALSQCCTEDKCYQSYKPDFTTKTISDYTPELLIGRTRTNYSEARNKTLIQINKYYKNNVLILYNQDIKEFDFWKTTEYKEEITKFSYIDTMYFIVTKIYNTKCNPNMLQGFQHLFFLYNGTVKLLGYYRLYGKYWSYQNLIDDYIVFGSTEAKIMSIILDFVRYRDYSGLIIELYLFLYLRSYPCISTCFGRKLYSTIDVIKTINGMDQQTKLFHIEAANNNILSYIRDSVNNLLTV
jgi:predicted acylesterase/phospholipase RssA